MKFKNIFARRSVVAGAIAALTLGFVGLGEAGAASIEDLYKGKTLTILIGHPPGGSYDLYAQLAAAHLGRFVPGNPNVIVQHMPGGGGSKGAAHYMANIEPDGMTIALLPDTMAHVQLLRQSEYLYLEHQVCRRQCCHGCYHSVAGCFVEPDRFDCAGCLALCR